MGFTIQTISTSTDELTFIQSFISAITNADNRITCLTNNLAQQFDDTNNTPSFTLSIDGIDSLTFTRGYNLTNSIGNYTVDDSSGRLYSAVQLNFSSSGLEHYSISSRTFKIKVVSGTKALLVSLGGYDTDTDTPNMSLLTIRDGSLTGSLITSGSYASAYEYFVLSDSTAANCLHRLPYNYSSSDATQIEIIKSKVYLAANSADKAFVTNAVYDSSNCTPDSLFNIGNKRYYSLDKNTIVEI